MDNFVDITLRIWTETNCEYTLKRRKLKYNKLLVTHFMYQVQQMFASQGIFSLDQIFKDVVPVTDYN
jgi:hypothetical protein